MHDISYYNVVYKKQKTWFLYPIRDIILYKQLYYTRSGTCPVFSVINLTFLSQISTILATAIVENNYQNQAYSGK